MWFAFSSASRHADARRSAVWAGRNKGETKRALRDMAEDFAFTAERKSVEVLLFLETALELEFDDLFPIITVDQATRLMNEDDMPPPCR